MGANDDHKIGIFTTKVVANLMKLLRIDLFKTLM
jgi:hypothetical protein